MLTRQQIAEIRKADLVLVSDMTNKAVEDFGELAALNRTGNPLDT
ncbi:hypothetical protein PPMP20_01155 [Paraburkholderia phymatum]|uniref:Uncharacterized protein n=1 Tax=Paraburkholderia phymatum (strain DSM 17167 / CIP 108236 / LMG 21445 / STM815) TaxID=391038 RepID=B2JVT7_PARP8|nr:hypothetical protein [Paraburkholderia phymatum]ACC75064.1 hypothetical protein Bphy_6002 [Paraburkholderia phymatum STM815]